MVAHGFELADGGASRFLGVEPGEVVPAGIAVAGGGRGDVPDRNQQCTLHGDVCPQGPRRGAIRRYLAARWVFRVCEIDIAAVPSAPCA